MTIYARRRVKNITVLALSLGATAFGIGWLTLILGTLIWEALAGLSLSVFTEMTPPPGSAGGLLNPIVGMPISALLPRNRPRPAPTKPSLQSRQR